MPLDDILITVDLRNTAVIKKLLSLYMQLEQLGKQNNLKVFIDKTETSAIKTYEKFKKQLEERKNKLEEELSSIAKKDPLVKNDYDAKFPDYGTQSSDEEAFEVASYESNLSMEQALEIKLAEIKAALERIEKGTYGSCETCGKPMEKERLEANPSARISIKHGHSL